MPRLRVSLKNQTKDTIMNTFGEIEMEIRGGNLCWKEIL